MKTTIDIPDDLYRRVKAKTSLQGKRIRELAIELFSRWLESDEGGEPEAPESALKWLGDWERMADRFVAQSAPGPSARELLEESRNRLDPDR